MDIAAPASTSGASTSPPRGSEGSTDTFLQLLVAQLRAQNPLEPQKGTEFVTQLAQFNTLEQLIAIRAELQAIRQLGERGEATPGATTEATSGSAGGTISTGNALHGPQAPESAEGLTSRARQ